MLTLTMMIMMIIPEIMKAAKHIIINYQGWTLVGRLISVKIKSLDTWSFLNPKDVGYKIQVKI